MIRAIIFDCFGVLYVDPTAYFYGLAAQNHSPQQHARMTELIRQTVSGHLSREMFSSQVAELFGIPAETARDKLFLGVQKNDELVDFIPSLRPKYKTGLLSNISQDTIGMFLSSRELDGLFDDYLLSGDVGMIKPDPRIYQLAAKRLKVAPQSCIFIDDSPKNCDGARQAGMQAIHFTSNHQLKTELDRLLVREGEK